MPHDSILKLTRTCPRVGDVLWRDTLVDAAIFREWMIGLGRLSAYTRIAHLLCEVFVRLISPQCRQELGPRADYGGLREPGCGRVRARRDS
jgi:hypothetical protein